MHGAASKRKGRPLGRPHRPNSWSFAVHGESGRRFNVGRSSSVLFGSVDVGFLDLSDCSVFVRSVGLPGPLFTALGENMIFPSRAFPESNSEVVTMYSGFDGRIDAISFCVFSMRSGVGGCVENTFGIVPGRRFSSA